MKQFSLKFKVLSGVILAIMMMAALLLALPAQSGAIEGGYGYKAFQPIQVCPPGEPCPTQPIGCIPGPCPTQDPL